MLRLNTVLAALGCATLGCSSEDSRPPPLVDCPTDAACSAGYRPPLAGGSGSSPAVPAAPADAGTATTLDGSSGGSSGGNDGSSGGGD